MNMTKDQVYSLIEGHYAKERDAIVGRVSRYMGSKYNAEDVVQEAYVRMLTYWKAYDPKQAIGKWFSTILTNSIKDYFKKEIVHGMSQDIPPDDMAPVRILQRIELNRLVELIEEQEPRIARILNLHLIEGYTSQEVACLVPESASNVRKITQRFRELLPR